MELSNCREFKGKNGIARRDSNGLWKTDALLDFQRTQGKIADDFH